MSDPRFLTETFAVSPQIAVEDLDAIQASGFRTILCNRPDNEVPPELQAAAIEAGCKSRGLGFILNPLSHGTLSSAHIKLQRQSLTAKAPILAYCASGNRSSILWALAVAGDIAPEEIIQRTSAAGYNLTAFLPQLHAQAADRAR